MYQVKVSSAICVLLLICLLTSCDSSDEGEIEVIRYGGPEISWDNVPNWTGSVEDGVVTLHFSYIGSDEEKTELEGKDISGIEVGEMVVVSLMDNGTKLPAFVSAERRVAPEFTGSYKALRMGPMHSGTIEVKTWEIDRVVRGRIKGKLGLVADNDIYFSARFSGDAQ